MSYEVVTNNQFKIAFGILEPDCPFVEIFEIAAKGELPSNDEDELPQIEIDAVTGINIHNENTVKRHPAIAARLTTLRVSVCDDVAELAALCGFNIKERVRELWLN